MRYLFLLACALVAATGCSRPNRQPPVAIGEVVAFRERSDAIGIRFSLVDAAGRPTAASGKVQIGIFQIETLWSPLAGRSFERRDQLHLLVFDVVPEGFVPVRTGIGEDRRDTLLYNVGELPYADFTVPPTAARGVVEMRFYTADGQTLRASDTLTF